MRSTSKDQPSQSADEDPSDFVLMVDNISEDSKTSSEDDDVQLRLEWMSVSLHRERKCADTIGTVPVPWAGHFPMPKYKYIFQTKYTEAILPDSTRKLLWVEISKMLVAVFKNIFVVLFILIFGILLFPMLSTTPLLYSPRPHWTTKHVYIHTLVSAVASPGNQHCANCVGTLSFR